ncbi:unnamed protein product [Lymnaea stagnalis]|uniref:Uncharacterized protein n=1 Tax=Lymnaea stagnalis TaxID=6523 RepID=A0AAV2IC46_LYMST
MTSSWYSYVEMDYTPPGVAHGVAHASKSKGRVLLPPEKSNKGASKQRRDQINAEIATMRDLLPLPESSRQRLSQLQIMSLTCVYIRKCNVLHKLFRPKSQEPQLPDSLDFFQALTGFLLVTTREGKLLYISENVTDYLGHSMVDMKTQGDSLFDIVDKRDHSSVRAQLLQGGNLDDKDAMPDVSFFCRMNMSRTLKRQSGFGDVKVMHVRGHFIRTTGAEPGSPMDSQCVFMATCSPLITPDLKENLVQNNTMVFKTVHQLDMSFVEVTKTAEFHMGYTTEEMFKKSWYSMLHPEDIHEAKEKHLQLIRSNHEMGCMMTVRMLKADGTIFWVNLVMHIRQANVAQNDEPLIVCVNQVIDAQEAYQIKVQGHMFSMFPSRPHDMWGNQYPSAIPQTSQDPTSGHWIQHSSPLPVQNYQTNIPTYIAQGAHSPIYNMPTLSPCRMTKASQDLTALNPASLVHSDQLKAMLKRKIQGPHSGSCKPGKVAKTSWDMDRSSGGNGYTEMEHSMPMYEHYAQAPVPSHTDCSGQIMQVIQPTNYRSGVMTAKHSHKYVNCQGMVSSMSSVFSEQVVPDVNLPDSYLTPDPSPVSSPEPSYVSVKTEVIDAEVRNEQQSTSVDILLALEKLAAHPQESRPQNVPVVVTETADVAPIPATRLPVFDAFDIDNFFDTLKMPGEESKTSLKAGALPLKSEIKSEVAEEPLTTENIPNFAALKEDRSSPRHAPSCSSAVEKQPLPQPEGHPLSMSLMMSETYYEPTPEISYLSQDLPFQDTRPAQAGVSVKDKLVGSVTKPSTKQDKTDELLSYFSDDGADIPPLHMESGSFYLDQSFNSDLLDDQYENFYQKPYSMVLYSSNQPQLGHQLSPLSSNSSLAGEDDIMDDDHSTDLLDRGLMGESQTSSFKDRDVLGIHDDFKLDFSDFFVPSQGSLDIIKHGQ